MNIRRGGLMFFSRLATLIVVLLAAGCASEEEGTPSFQQTFVDTQRGLNVLDFTVHNGDVDGSSADWYDGSSAGLRGELMYDRQGCISGELHAEGENMAQNIAANNNTTFVLFACPGDLLQAMIVWGETEFDMDFVGIEPCDGFFACDTEIELDTGFQPVWPLWP